MTTREEIAPQRLHNQRLGETSLLEPADVVAWFGAVQAQEYALAKWALGIRIPHATDDLIEQAFTDGSILRTHVMRPTWHFVAPADIRWLLDLTGPRVRALNAYMDRQLELDDQIFARSNAAIVAALQGGNQLTRSELAVVLDQAGIAAAGQRLAYLVMRAELDGIICSGARRGKQFTYALIAERAPQAMILGRDEALAELIKRFFASHGPATAHDCAWWSGLTIADVQAGLEMVTPHLIHEEIAGKRHWRSTAIPPATSELPAALLLPPYDEYVIAYRDHRAILDPMHADQARNAVFGGVTVIKGQVVGNWRRRFSKGVVVIESAPFRPFTHVEQQAFAVAAQRFGDFLGLPVVLA